MPREFGLSLGGQGEVGELESVGSGRLLPTEGGSQSGEGGARRGEFPLLNSLICSTEQGQPASFNCSDFHIITSADEDSSSLLSKVVQGTERVDI